MGYNQGYSACKAKLDDDAMFGFWIFDNERMSWRMIFVEVQNIHALKYSAE